MVLDSQCLQHLNILDFQNAEESKQSKQEEGSLFAFINHCRTPFGKRQLKRWLMSPLLNPDMINDRLDSVADLISYQFETDKVREPMGKLPDLEKLLAKIFTYSIKHRCKAVYFEDVSLIKMKEFRQLLNTMSQLPTILTPLMNRVNDFKSSRLKHLLTSNKQGEEDENVGLFPHNLQWEISQFDKLIKWKKVAGTETEIPEPQEGLDDNFDEAN